MKSAKVIFGSSLPNYPPHLALPLAGQTWFRWSCQADRMWSSQNLPPASALSPGPKHLHYKFVYRYEDMLASFQSHHRLGPVCHCVPYGLLQWLPTCLLESSLTQSNISFTKQSQWVFLKHKYDQITLLLQSFSGSPLSSSRDKLFTSSPEVP